MGQPIWAVLPLIILILLLFLFISPRSVALGGLKHHLNVEPKDAETRNAITAGTADFSMQRYREAFHKFQNLERHPDALAKAKDMLVVLLSESILEAQAEESRSILSLNAFDPIELTKYLDSEFQETMRNWQQYLARRRHGGSMELFGNATEARQWIINTAPSKLVDGVWLNGVHQVGTPFDERRVTKDLWQIFSEELGDGDQEKNHVQVYLNLLESIGVSLPAVHTRDFIDTGLGMNDPRAWRSAVAQLCVSLFPREFLPEIIGFNLHFEQVTLETLIAAKELSEANLDPYYFNLHISIDNAHSGHTAIAQKAVLEYLNHLHAKQGYVEMQAGWRRIQAGYILSEKATSVAHGLHGQNALSKSDKYETGASKIFHSKIRASQGLHCAKRRRVGSRTLAEWLDEVSFASESWRKAFMRELANTKPWVIRGSSHQSTLIKEMLWGGKMFGAFTPSEVETIKTWIDSMSPCDDTAYWSFVGQRNVSRCYIFDGDAFLTDYAGFQMNSMPGLKQTRDISSLQNVIRRNGKSVIPNVLPLWFTHTCLLESLLSVPYRATTTLHSAVLRILRAQNGFLDEAPIAAGMDEASRKDTLGIHELGLEMAASITNEELADTNQVLELWPSDFALFMIELSRRPSANLGLLLGMTRAFVDLQDAISRSSPSTVISRTSCATLDRIVDREKAALHVCQQELVEFKVHYDGFFQGYNYAWGKIKSALNS